MHDGGRGHHYVVHSSCYSSGHRRCGCTVAGFSSFRASVALQRGKKVSVLGEEYGPSTIW